MATIGSNFRELNVYKLARKAASEIFELSKSFPKEERYVLTDQIRRSSRATKAMLAEAWARRRYKAVFVSKIDEAWERQLKHNRGSMTRWIADTSRKHNSKG